jgi:class 3 adenylate cyclase
VRLPSSDIRRITAYALAAGLGLGLFIYGLIRTVETRLPLTTPTVLIVALLIGALLGGALLISAILALRQVAHDLRVYAAELLEADLPNPADANPRDAIGAMRRTLKQSIEAIPRSAALTRLAGDLAETSDLNHALETTVHYLSPHIPVQGAMLLLLDAERSVLTPAAAWGRTDVNRAATLETGETAIGRALYENRVTVYAGTQIRDLLTLRPGPDSPALLSLPMHVHGQPFGLLGLFIPADHRLNDEQRTYGRSVAGLLTLAAQGGMHRRLFERESDRLAAFEQLGTLLTHSEGLEHALEQVLRAAARVTDSEHGSLLLLEPDETNVRFRVTLRAGTVLPLSVVAGPILKHGLAGWALRERRADIVEDTERDTRWLPTPGLDAMRSVLVVPLLYGERALGVLTLADPAPRHYSRRSLALVSALAAYAVTILARMQFEAMVEPSNAARVRRLFDGRIAPTDVTRLLVEPQRFDQLLAPQTSAVVVVYAGIRGLERSIAQLNAAQLIAEVITPYLDEIIGLAQQHHGYLAQHDDTGTLIIFGYPISSPDDKAHALRAAAAMRQAARRLRGRWQAGLSCNLGISFGVAWGEMIAGVVGSDTAPTLTVVGAAVREARRLQQLARTDEVLVATELATDLPPDGSFQMEALAPIALADGTPSRTVYRLNAIRA